MLHELRSSVGGLFREISADLRFFLVRVQNFYFSGLNYFFEYVPMDLDSMLMTDAISVKQFIHTIGFFDSRFMGVSSWFRKDMPGIYKYSDKEKDITWEKPYVDRVSHEVEVLFNFLGYPLTDTQKSILRECLVGRQRKFYKIYNIPKKSGGVRVIEAPCDELKAMQKILLKHFVSRIWRANNSAYGFVPKRNIADCARWVATGRIPVDIVEGRSEREPTKRVLLKCDLKDFFPSITSARLMRALTKQWFLRMHNTANWCFWEDLGKVFDSQKRRGRVFRRRGLLTRGKYTYSPLAYTRDDTTQVAIAMLRFMHLISGILAIACIDDRLPQGSPLSPYLSNLFMYDFDVGMTNEASQKSSRYARYADDVCCLCNSRDDANFLLNLIKRKVIRLGLHLNDKKTAILQHGKPMRVVGLNINHKVSFSRYKRKKIKSIMFNIVCGKCECTPHLFKQLTGYRSLFNMTRQWPPEYENLYLKIREKQ